MYTSINHVPKGISRLNLLSHLEGFAVGGACDNNTKMQGEWNIEELGPVWLLRRHGIIKLEI